MKNTNKLLTDNTLKSVRLNKQNYKAKGVTISNRHKAVIDLKK